ncbi:Small ribosomal subunit protein [Trichinella spiralis]|uniref:Small ribosomal subunit protein n=1 Tax=Trichinella spiralis TaxID=6334 RepID=A0ABR3KKC2_TRISP
MSKDEDNGSKTENKSEVSLEEAMQHKLEKYEKMFKDRYSEKDSTFEKATFPPALVVRSFSQRPFCSRPFS